jgi:hypothetical protein
MARSSNKFARPGHVPINYAENLNVDVSEGNFRPFLLKNCVFGACQLCGVKFDGKSVLKHKESAREFTTSFEYFLCELQGPNLTLIRAPFVIDKSIFPSKQ